MPHASTNSIAGITDFRQSWSTYTGVDLGLGWTPVRVPGGGWAMFQQ